ncbi:glycosyltransferase family 41 protein [Polynucleobacter sp. AM-7D1]|uniref:tetratricopeptide repeat protein n=1 Tax=Polynucleobacter sp. AM-7D1 TaxID=2689102 RepID=UPI001BFD0ABC|nr:glycosyltransferase family 41 protein [Polynucleobacter sp. AM-7D1]QWE28838.1 tetratricopeptide repeat protein [Polynucleobacter sp. AM-7D1]
MNPYQVSELLSLAQYYFYNNNQAYSQSLLKIIIEAVPFHSQANEILAYIHDANSNYDESFRHLNIACSQVDCSGEALYSLGVAQLNKNLHSEAIGSFQKAIDKKGEFFEVLHDMGTTFAQLGNLNAALFWYKKCVGLKNDSHVLFFNMGRALDGLEKYDDALSYYDNAIQLQPQFFEAWFNKGVTLAFLKQYDKAIVCYDKAIILDSKNAEVWFNKGVSLNGLEASDEALSCYENAIRLQSQYFEAWFNKGVTLAFLRQYDKAIVCYDKAIELNPKYAEAWSNKAIALNDLKRHEEALRHYDKAIELNPKYAEAWSNKAIALNDLKRHEEALRHYDKAIELNSNLNFLCGDRLHTKMQICDWNNFEEDIDVCINKIESMQCAVQPFSLLALVDDPQLHKKCSEIFVNKYCLGVKGLVKDAKEPLRHPVIKIGYFSADFHNHATSHLMVELFEKHNHDDFEFYGFSFGPETDDEIRMRIRKSFKNFFSVNGLTDFQVASLSRDVGIDIAVDLKGFTRGSRPNIFSNRCAPIQVSYLGYPGTMGAKYIDYLVADKVLVLDCFQEFYSEKLIYMPCSYQVNDSQKKVSSKKFTRGEAGLPNDAFVFCCFNNSYKITPEIFSAWMKILLSVDGSVLWLLRDNHTASDNLRREAKKWGVLESRLIFAPKLPMDQHLARHQLADLFLDTFPYNAHTTASDALWVGLPVLTYIGKSFASRVSASLLHELQLDELVADTLEEYQNKAVQLAKDPKLLSKIEQKLKQNRHISNLFDADYFARHIESAYKKIYANYISDLKPENIEVQ